MDKIKYIYILAISALLIIVLSGSSLLKINPEPKVYDNFSLFDYNNKLNSIEDYTDKKGIVIMFISTQCPVSNAYNNRMQKLNDDFESEFSFIGINSNKQENIDEIKQHASDNELKFVILKDSKNLIADRFEANSTPEVYVLSNNFEQLYHGRIDDSRNIENITVSDLRNVLTEIIKGEQISIKETKAFGCSIKRVSN